MSDGVVPLPHLPAFAQLSDRVWRVLGLNPSRFTLQGTNTYLLGTGPRKLMIDCGQGVPEYIPLLEESLQKISPDAYISDIIITHGHSDHYGGLEGILSSDTLNRKRDPIRVHKFPGGPPVPKGRVPVNLQWQPLHDNQVFTVDSVTLRVIHTPGHTSDHCTFYLEEEDSLFTADCILGFGTAVFEDLAQYVDSLKRILELQPKRLYPGHGSVVDNGVAKIEEYIQNRVDRELQLIQILKSSPGERWSAAKMTEVIYNNLPDIVYVAAARGIVQHLVKLEQEGFACMTDGSSHGARLVDLIDKEWFWVGSRL